MEMVAGIELEVVWGLFSVVSFMQEDNSHGLAMRFPDAGNLCPSLGNKSQHCWETQCGRKRVGQHRWPAQVGDYQGNNLLNLATLIYLPWKTKFDINIL